MKNKHTDHIKRMEHILKAIDDIEKYLSNEGRESFLANELLQQAILYNFTVIGEAVVHLDNEMLKKHDYPWYKVRAFRNMIAHEYFNIEMSSVWLTVKENLPELRSVIISMLQDE